MPEPFLLILSILFAFAVSLIIYFYYSRNKLLKEIEKLHPQMLTKSTSTSEIFQNELSSCELFAHRSPSDEEYLESGRFQRLFEKTVLIGKGGFGEVYKAVHKVEQTTYAIKRVLLTLSPDSNVKDHRLYREVKTLTEVEHPNVVRFYTSWIEDCFDFLEEEDSKEEEDIDEQRSSFQLVSDYNISGVDFAFDKSDESSSLLSRGSVSGSVRSKQKEKGKSRKIYLFIQMAYCGNNSLKTFLDTRKHIDYTHNFLLFSQIINGLKYLHSKKIIHRDLKPSNIFMPTPTQIKIGDFGLARIYNGKYITSSCAGNSKNSMALLTGNIGSPFYVAPEQQDGNKYNEKVDIYSLGIILLELFSQFYTIHERNKFFKMNLRNEAEEIPAGISCEIWKLIKRLVSVESEKRPSVFELEHFKSFLKWKRKVNEVN